MPLQSGNEGDLRFEIVHIKRDKAPPYTVISYTWGDGEVTLTIRLNGQTFYIRVNLWSCLYYLSLHAPHAQWTHLWADAICINQNDAQERNTQVRLMDQTYRNATCVSVWLGLIPLPNFITFSGQGPLQCMAMPSRVPCLFRRPDLKIEPNHMRSTFRANLGMRETNPENCRKGSEL